MSSNWSDKLRICEQLLRLVRAQAQQQHRTSHFSVQFPFTLGYEMFKRHNTSLHLYKRADCAAYGKLLPADYEYLLWEPSDEFKDTQEFAIKAQVDERNKQSVHDRGTDSSRPQNFDAILTKLANSGLYVVTPQDLCQEVWPSPSSAAWQGTQQLALAVAAVIEWMHCNVQRSRSVASDTPDQEYYKLEASLFQLLHALLLGHMTDLSLDMSQSFAYLLDIVMERWSESDVTQDYASASQLGRAFLRRLALDDALARNLFKEVNEHQVGQIGLSDTFNMMGEPLLAPHRILLVWKLL